MKAVKAASERGFIRAVGVSASSSVRLPSCGKQRPRLCSFAGPLWTCRVPRRHSSANRFTAGRCEGETLVERPTDDLRWFRSNNRISGSWLEPYPVTRPSHATSVAHFPQISGRFTAGPRIFG